MKKLGEVVRGAKEKAEMAAITMATSVNMALISNTVCVMADEEGTNAITNNIISALDYWRLQIATVAGSVAGFCFVVCLVLTMTSNEDRKVKTYWEWGKRIIITLVLIAATPTIVVEVYNWALTAFATN